MAGLLEGLTGTSERRRLTSALQACQDANRRLEGEVVALREKLGRTGDALAMREAELEAVRREGADAKRSVQAEIAGLNDTLAQRGATLAMQQAEVEALRLDLTEARRSSAEHEAEVAAMWQRLAASRRQADEQQAASIAAESRLAAAEQTAHDAVAQIEVVTSRCDDLDTAATELQARLASALQELVESRLEASRFNGRAHEMESSVAALESERAALQSALAAAKAEQTVLRATLAAAEGERDSAMARLSEATRAQAFKQAETARQLEALSAAVEALRRDVADRDREIGVLREKLAESRALQSAQQERNATLQQDQDTGRQHESAERAATELKLKAIVTRIASAMSLTQTGESTDVEDLCDGVAKFVGRLEQAEQDNAAHRARLEEFDVLRSDLSASDRDRQQLAAECAVLRQDLETARSDLSVAVRINSASQADLRDLQRRYGDLLAVRDQKDELLRRLRSQFQGFGQSPSASTDLPGSVSGGRQIENLIPAGD